MIRPRSIRAKLTLWYAGILALTLLGFGALFYLSVSFSLRREVDRSLHLQAEGIAAGIHSFREAEQASDGSAPGNWRMSPPSFPGGFADRGLFPGLVERWAEKTGSLEGDRTIRMLDKAGRPIIASDLFQQLRLPDVGSVRAKAFREEKQTKTDLYKTFRRPAGPFRLVTHRMTEGGRLQGFVQVASSLRPLAASLGLLRLWLGSLIPFILLVATLAGWFLTSRALDPVDRIITQVEQIDAEALEKRVDIPNTGDELERLARTFDHMLERIERAFRRVRQFSAAASHELRTPLTVMKGELELALRRPREAREYEEALRTHLDALNDLIQVVEELLMLARSEAAKGAVEWRPVDLNRLVHSVAGLWGKVAQRKGVRLEIEPGEPVWVTGEKRLLERLIANLLDNGIRATPKEGRVTLQAAECSHQAQITVQDTGPGIQGEDLPQIFDRFFQPRAGAADERGGSAGLGLGLCRWIAEAHHGRIEVSTELGRGTLFTLWLPLRPDLRDGR